MENITAYPTSKERTFQNNLDRIGNTPLVRVEVPELNETNLFMKLEGENPTGSIKDRTALGIIKAEIENGNLSKGKTILDASSGSYACAISYIGKILGFPVKVISGSKLTDDKKNFIEYFGAELSLEGDFTIEGNRACRKIFEENPDKYCFLDQLHNWSNADTHFKTTGPEILEAMPEVENIAFSLGSGGTMNGVVRFFKKNKPEVKFIGITAASGTKIPGTGSFVDGDYVTPFIQELFDKELLDHIAVVDIDSAKKGVRNLREQGFYVGIQTGAVFHGLKSGLRELNSTRNTIMISGDAGWKNSDKLVGI